MKKLLICILIFCSQLLAVGQGNFPSENGLFEVDYLKGCPGTTITVTPLRADGDKFFCFDADVTDPTSSENLSCLNAQANTASDSTYTYSEPGEYKILFYLQLTNRGLYDSITIEIIEPEIPALAFANCNDSIYFDLDPERESFDIYTLDFGDGSLVQDYNISEFPVVHSYTDNTLSYTVQATGKFDDSGFDNCNNNTFTKDIIPADLLETAASITSVNLLSDRSFEISYTANENQLYTLELRQGNNPEFQQIKTIIGESSGTHIFDDINLRATFYCARIVSNSLCSNQVLTSNTACTVQLNGSAQQDGNLLSWNTANFASTILRKNNIEIYAGTPPFLDSAVLCGQINSYQLIATDSSGLQIQSLPVQLTATVTPDQSPISQIATRVLSSRELEISWLVPSGLQPATYTIYKKRNIGDEYFIIGNTDSTTFLDVTIDLTETLFYYSVSYTDDCGNESPLVSVAVNLQLKAKQSGNVINFSWNQYTGYDSLLSNYLVKKYDADMNLVQEWDRGNDRFFDDNVADAEEQKYFYQVEALSETGLISYSNILEYKIPPTFFVPSGFTPNGDYRNEELKVVGKFISEIEFSIYNRWGALIFRSTDLERGWDGFLPDREAPEGTYSYTVTVTDQFGEEYFKSGVFNLIR